MKNMKMKTLIFVALASMMSATVSAQMSLGDTAVINFTKTGNTVGGNWNEVEGESGGTIAAGILIADLIRFSDGTATGVELSVEGSGLGADLFGIGGRDEEPFDSSRIFPVSGAIPNVAQENLTYHSDTPQRFVFSGLDDTLTYNLSILSANTGGTRNAHNWIANPGPGQFAISVNPNDGLVHTFSNLSTDGLGNIVLQNSSDAGGIDAQHLNAMELTAIPEPGTLILLGLGLGAAFVFRRRRS